MSDEKLIEKVICTVNLPRYIIDSIRWLYEIGVIVSRSEFIRTAAEKHMRDTLTLLDQSIGQILQMDEELLDNPEQPYEEIREMLTIKERQIIRCRQLAEESVKRTSQGNRWERIER